MNTNEKKNFVYLQLQRNFLSNGRLLSEAGQVTLRAKAIVVAGLASVDDFYTLALACLCTSGKSMGGGNG